MRRLEHIGIAVAEADATLDILKRVLGTERYKQETVEAEGVATHFLLAGSTKLELLESLGSDSPIAGFLEKRGPGVHHLAFEVDDLDAEAERLKADGFTLLGTVRPGADGKRIVFLHPRETGRILIELCEQATWPNQASETGPVVVVPDTSENAALAHALAARCRVQRSGPAPWASVHPPADLAGSGVCILMDDGVGAPASASLTIGLGVAGDVQIPKLLWKGLPDPWGVVADLVIQHLATERAA
ncbi:MAG: methylmalonyl-CoA epimerase [Rhodothermales bacterium]|nr:methylmalonyl-CoA epimerase [Rhodothermales bacterium]MBO6781309.1 methylmalonyl-CoA epimerase [Rhodothermales bacterium]